MVGRRRRRRHGRKSPRVRGRRCDEAGWCEVRCGETRARRGRRRYGNGSSTSSSRCCKGGTRSCSGGVVGAAVVVVVGGGRWLFAKHAADTADEVGGEPSFVLGRRQEKGRLLHELFLLSVTRLRGGNEAVVEHVRAGKNHPILLVLHVVVVVVIVVVGWFFVVG